MGISDAVQDIELQAAEESRYGDDLDHDTARGVGLGQSPQGGESPAMWGACDE